MIRFMHPGLKVKLENYKLILDLGVWQSQSRRGNHVGLPLRVADAINNIGIIVGYQHGTIG